jgi:pimeloyl-ACP methyl ester carboxylesterase
VASTSTELTFPNEFGVMLAATLCTPGGVDPTPAVSLCQGMSGVRNLVLPHVAERLAEIGIASLRFDYAGFGDSEGERGWIDPAARAQDARVALEVLMSRPSVDADRIGVYGHSLGGPVALATASGDGRVRAVAAVSSPGGGLAMLRAARPAWEWVALKHRVSAERARIESGEAPTVVGIEEIFPFSPKFAAAYAALKASQGGTSAMAAGSGLGTSSFYLATVDRIVASRPEVSAAGLAYCATLLVNGVDDDTAPIEDVEPVFAAISGPKHWELVPDADHNDLDGGAGLDSALDHVCTWFTEHL